MLTVKINMGQIALALDRWDQNPSTHPLTGRKRSDRIQLYCWVSDLESESSGTHINISLGDLDRGIRNKFWKVELD
jgi:hypothetical protein